MEVTEVNIDMDKLKGLVDRGLETLANKIVVDIKERAVYTVYEGGNPSAFEGMGKEMAMTQGWMPIWEGHLRDSLEVVKSGDMEYTVYPNVEYAEKLSEGGTKVVDENYQKWAEEKRGEGKVPPLGKTVEIRPHTYMWRAAEIQGYPDRAMENRTLIADAITQG